MKVLKWFAGFLVVVLIAIVLIGNFFLGSLVKKSVNAVGPSVVGVPVTLEDASFRLIQGKATLEGLVIGNPEGFHTEQAFGLGRISVDLDPKSLTTDTIHIRRIEIDAPEISYEMGLGKSNIGALIDQMSKGKDGEKKEEKAGEEPAEKSATKVVIDEIVIADGKILLSAKLLGGAGVPLPLPTITMKDIGKESGGATPTEVISKVLSTILGAVTSVVSESGKLVGKGAEAAVEGVEAVGGAAVEGVEAVGKGAADLIKGVGGILGGSEK